MNDKYQVETTTNKMGKPACQTCMNLQFNQSLVNKMTRSAARNYPVPIPDSVVPVSVISTQMSDTKANSNNKKLQIISHC